MIHDRTGRVQDVFARQYTPQSFILRLREQAHVYLPRHDLKGMNLEIQMRLCASPRAWNRHCSLYKKRSILASTLQQCPGRGCYDNTYCTTAKSRVLLQVYFCTVGCLSNVQLFFDFNRGTLAEQTVVNGT